MPSSVFDLKRSFLTASPLRWFSFISSGLKLLAGGFKLPSKNKNDSNLPQTTCCAFKSKQQQNKSSLLNKKITSGSNITVKLCVCVSCHCFQSIRAGFSSSAGPTWTRFLFYWNPTEQEMKSPDPITRTAELPWGIMGDLTQLLRLLDSARLQPSGFNHTRYITQPHLYTHVCEDCRWHNSQASWPISFRRTRHPKTSPAEWSHDFIYWTRRQQHFQLWRTNK